MRLKKKRNYQKPVITNILLDDEQAILQVCRIGGAFFGWNLGSGIIASQCSGVAGGGSHCAIACKGQSRAAGLATLHDFTAQPS